MPEIVLIIGGVVALLALITGIGFFRSWFNARPGRYFIRYATQQQKLALRNAEIPFTDEHLRSDHDPGIFFKRKYLDRAVRALDSYIVVVFPTPVPRIHEIAVRPNVVRPTNLAHFTVQGQHVFPTGTMIEKLIGDIVIPAVRTNVVIHHCRGQVYEPRDDDALNIFVYSRARRGEATYMPNRFVGVENEPWDYAYTASGLGVPLSDNGHVYGELIGNNLYLLGQMQHLSGPRLAQFMRLLEKAAPELDIDLAVEQVLRSLPPLPRHLNANDRRLSVFDEGFNGRRKVVMRALLQHVLVPAVANHIHVMDGNGGFRNEFRDEMFHVFHGAVPTAGALPSGRGIILTDESTNAEIGELIGNNLYLYKPVIKYGSSQEARELARLLLIVRKDIMAEMDATAADGMHGERFIDACLKQASPYATLEAPASNDELQKAEEGLRQLLAEVRKSEQEVYRLEGSPDTALGAEFDSLLRIGKVRDVTVNDNEIIVDTRMMFCRDPRSGLLHRIGEFYIHIPLSSGSVRFHNKAGPVELGGGYRMHAPHVNSAGNACLGNTADLFPQLIRERQYASAVQLAIAFLESVNVNDSWGRNISSFPVAGEEPKAKKKKKKAGEIAEAAASGQVEAPTGEQPQPPAPETQTAPGENQPGTAPVTPNPDEGGQQ